MSKPLRCSSCGDFIGVYSDFHSRKYNKHCPGQGKHSKTIITESLMTFKLLTRRTNYYPDTKTTSTWLEYHGNSTFMLKILKRIYGRIYDATNKKWSF